MVHAVDAIVLQGTIFLHPSCVQPVIMPAIPCISVSERTSLVGFRCLFIAV